MDFVRRWTAQIQAQLGNLRPVEKMFFAVLGLIAFGMIWAVAQFAAQPEMVALHDQPIDASRRAQITGFLDGRGIEYKLVGDRVHVPMDRSLDAMASLQMQQLLPENTNQAFDAIIEAQTWWQSSEQNRQRWNYAKQKVLEQTIRAFPWARDSTVIISLPLDTGFGATAKRPTASVNVVMTTGGIDQKQVDAIAGLVSGAVAEMRPEDVTVIDAVAGRQWKVRTDGQAMPTDYLEAIQAQEVYFREKIANGLGYIRNLVVAVNVEVDMVRRQTHTTSFDKDKSVELLTEERTQNTSTTDAATSGEPGVRANTGADIASGGSTGRTSTTDETQSKFEPQAGKIEETALHVAGAPVRISATVNVPRSYFVSLFMQGKEAGGPAPTDDALKPIMDEHLPRLQKQVETLVLARSPGQVVVDVYPDGMTGGGGFGPIEQPINAGGIGAVLADGLASQIVLGVLALVSLGTMGWMLRSASRKPPMPNVRDLAGIPPQLVNEAELVGVAGEANDALPGMELDDESIRYRQITEQLSEVIKTNPDEVATLINRWVRKRD